MGVQSGGGPVADVVRGGVRAMGAELYSVLSALHRDELIDRPDYFPAPYGELATFNMGIVSLCCTATDQPFQHGSSWQLFSWPALSNYNWRIGGTCKISVAGASWYYFAFTQATSFGTFHQYNNLFSCPASLLALFLMILPTIRMVLFHRRRRQRSRRLLGLCPSCGYDLRASAGRCPECGMESAVPTVPS
jgi:hypothetical protein